MLSRFYLVWPNKRRMETQDSSFWTCRLRQNIEGRRLKGIGSSAQNWSKVTLYVCIKRWRRRLLLQERKVRRTKRSKHLTHSRVKWKRPLRNIYIKRRHCCTAVTRHGRRFFRRLLSALDLLEAFYNERSECRRNFAFGSTWKVQRLIPPALMA